MPSPANPSPVSRRGFPGAAALLGSTASVPPACIDATKPALVGGKPAMEGAFSAWPVEDSAGEQAIADLARSGKRGRGNGPNIAAFEQKFAQLVSAGHCLATGGTGSDRACAEAVWFTQTMLLGPRRDMDAIAEAVRKVKKYAADLARA